MTRHWRRASGRWTISRARVVIHPVPAFPRCRAPLPPSNGAISLHNRGTGTDCRRARRIGGSRAQIDLVEFTLLKADLGADRLDDARRMLGPRRGDPWGIPVAGLAAVH